MRGRNTPYWIKGTHLLTICPLQILIDPKCEIEFGHALNRVRSFYELKASRYYRQKSNDALFHLYITEPDFANGLFYTGFIFREMFIKANLEITFANKPNHIIMTGKEFLANNPLQLVIHRDCAPAFRELLAEANTKYVICYTELPDERDTCITFNIHIPTTGFANGLYYLGYRVHETFKGRSISFDYNPAENG